MGNLSKADDMHDIGLSCHNYHEHNNSELRVLRVMLGNRWASVWFARTVAVNKKLTFRFRLYDRRTLHAGAKNGTITFTPTGT